MIAARSKKTKAESGQTIHRLDRKKPHGKYFASTFFIADAIGFQQKC